MNIGKEVCQVQRLWRHIQKVRVARVLAVWWGEVEKELGKEIWLQTVKGLQCHLKNTDYPMKWSATDQFLSSGRTRVRCEFQNKRRVWKV